MSRYNNNKLISKEEFSKEEARRKHLDARERAMHERHRMLENMAKALPKPQPKPQQPKQESAELTSLKNMVTAESKTDLKKMQQMLANVLLEKEKEYQRAKQELEEAKQESNQKIESLKQKLSEEETNVLSKIALERKTFDQSLEEKKNAFDAEKKKKQQEYEAYVAKVEQKLLEEQQKTAELEANLNEFVKNRNQKQTTLDSEKETNKQLLSQIDFEKETAQNLLEQLNAAKERVEGLEKIIGDSQSITKTVNPPTNATVYAKPPNTFSEAQVKAMQTAYNSKARSLPSDNYARQTPDVAWFRYIQNGSFPNYVDGQLKMIKLAEKLTNVQIRNLSDKTIQIEGLRAYKAKSEADYKNPTSATFDTQTNHVMNLLRSNSNLSILVGADMQSEMVMVNFRTRNIVDDGKDQTFFRTIDKRGVRATEKILNVFIANKDDAAVFYNYMQLFSAKINDTKNVLHVIMVASGNDDCSMLLLFMYYYLYYQRGFMEGVQEIQGHASDLFTYEIILIDCPTLYVNQRIVDALSKATIRRVVKNITPLFLPVMQGINMGKTDGSWVSADDIEPDAANNLIKSNSEIGELRNPFTNIPVAPFAIKEQKATTDDDNPKKLVVVREGKFEVDVTTKTSGFLGIVSKTTTTKHTKLPNLFFDQSGSIDKKSSSNTILYQGDAAFEALLARTAV